MDRHSPLRGIAKMLVELPSRIEEEELEFFFRKEAGHSLLGIVERIVAAEEGFVNLLRKGFKAAAILGLVANQKTFWHRNRNIVGLRGAGGQGPFVFVARLQVLQVVIPWDHEALFQRDI